MQSSIKTATAFGLALYSLGFAFLLAPDWTRKQFADWKNIVDLLAPAALGLAAYLVMGDIHNTLDRRLFRERSKVDDFIRERVTAPCREILCSRAIRDSIVPQESSKVMDLFYTFIPADDTERERAFSYWTTYFIATNLTVLSLIMTVSAIVIASVVPLLTAGQRIVFGVMALLAPALANMLRLSSRRKLHWPPQAQTTRIFAKQQDDLKTLLPKYRVYEATTLCLDSGKCPLVGRS